MDKGQHLRLLITDNSEKNVVGLATDLSLNLQAQTENSTTKDDGTEDANGVPWDVFEVTNRSGDITFGGMVGVGDDPYTPAEDEDPEQVGGLQFADWIDHVNDELINWKLVFVSGSKDRTIGKEVCHGQGKLSNVQATGQNQQNATYTGTISIYGPVTPGTD